jgi:hypothetical protein
MKNRIIIGILSLLFFGSVFAQDVTLPELKGFKKIMNYPVFGPDNLWDFIDGAAENYLAYGFIDLHVAEYKKGKNVIKLEVYHHKDNVMAFGIYSSERSPSFRFNNLGAQGYNAGGSINFFKGSYYVKIRTYSKSDKILNSAESLAREVAAMLPGDSKMPAVLSQFPEEGKKKNEETYINESVLGHKYLNRAYKASYQVGSDNFSIYLMVNSTREEARKTVDEYLAAIGMESNDVAGGKYVLTDGYNGTIFLAWKENMIVVISGLSKDQTKIADQYTSEILK